MEYFFNYDYIVTELCENKEKPELHCNGKCHLMKELAKASEDEKPVSGKKLLHHETEILFCNEVTDFTFNGLLVSQHQKNNTAYSNLYTHINTVSVFHPPAIIF